MCYLLCTCRGSHLPLRLHCGWSAGHGYLCCWKISERVFQGCGRYQCGFELSILLGEADRREPADRTLQTEVKSREKLGQVSLNRVTLCCHLQQCFGCLLLYPRGLALLCWSSWKCWGFPFVAGSWVMPSQTFQSTATCPQCTALWIWTSTNWSVGCWRTTSGNPSRSSCVPMTCRIQEFL